MGPLAIKSLQKNRPNRKIHGWIRSGNRLLCKTFFCASFRRRFCFLFVHVKELKHIHPRKPWNLPNKTYASVFIFSISSFFCFKRGNLGYLRLPLGRKWNLKINKEQKKKKGSCFVKKTSRLLKNFIFFNNKIFLLIILWSVNKMISKSYSLACFSKTRALVEEKDTNKFFFISRTVIKSQQNQSA